MKAISKKALLLISGISIVIAASLPFLFANKNSDYMTVLSTSLTSVSTAIAIIALYVGVILYQKFGLESKFIEKKAEKVLELVDLLKGKRYIIHTNKINYFLRFDPDDYEKINREPFYKYMKDLAITMNKEDYEIGTKEILNIRNSYWLPSEIRDKLEFFRVKAFIKLEVDKNNQIEYARLSFNSSEKKTTEWLNIYPNLTIDEFIKKKNELLAEIITWLSKHCDIKLDLRLAEPNQEITKANNDYTQ